VRRAGAYRNGKHACSFASAIRCFGAHYRPIGPLAQNVTRRVAAPHRSRVRSR
jgi:hypothetical protein